MLPFPTAVYRIESDVIDPRLSTIAAIRKALIKAGLELPQDDQKTEKVSGYAALEDNRLGFCLGLPWNVVIRPWQFGFAPLAGICRLL
jgi:hypothetical protein